MKLYDQITVHTEGNHDVFKKAGYRFEAGFLIVFDENGFDDHAFPISAVWKIKFTAPSMKDVMKLRAEELMDRHPDALIEVIKALRAEFGLTLKQAKDLTDLVK